MFDRFDQIFTAHFSGIEKIINELFKDVPEEWLRKQAQLMLTEEERAQIESMGGFEKLIETLKLKHNKSLGFTFRICHHNLPIESSSLEMAKVDAPWY